MRLYLAGTEGYLKRFFTTDIDFSKVSLLETFFVLQRPSPINEIIDKLDSFILDSGAFSFLSSCKDMPNFDSYVEKYAEYINAHNVDLFFELDIDKIVGIDKVEQYRDRLHELTGKHPIPVWHPSRGKQYFIDMCRAYDYVSLGGIVSKDLPRRKYETFFPWFIETAHQHGAKIHGLGYTSIKGIKKYKFDSVDSTSWLAGNKSGALFSFNGETILTAKIPAGYKLDAHAVQINNFKAWLQFQRYVSINY